MLKLNLGCGSKILKDYTNLDKFNYYKPDVVHDLETVPYPFDESSVDEIILSHVLEHIGQKPDIFNNIMKELFRISKNNNLIQIEVPHPRHDHFISDPTHVRPITVLGLQLYDKELNKKWEKENAANTPLGLIYNVNFKITKITYNLDNKYKKLYLEKKITNIELDEHARKYNNVIESMSIKLTAIKE
jgi:hypothetical protein